MNSPGPAPRYLCLVSAAVVLWALLAGTTAAQSTTPARNRAVAEQGAPWQSLSRAQREALAPLEKEWRHIDAQRKNKWLDVAQRMPSMSPDERARIQVRMDEWANMTPAERGRARAQFQEARQLAPSQRQERWKAYQSLPPDQRRALASGIAPTNPARPNGLTAADRKRNLVNLTPSGPAPRPVAPTVVQARPGATTSLVNKRPAPPSHSQAGLPKISASKGFVDPATLLPRRGAQAAAIAASPPADKASSARR
jgi:hypothetical protein